MKRRKRRSRLPLFVGLVLVTFLVGFLYVWADASQKDDAKSSNTELFASFTGMSDAVEDATNPPELTVLAHVTRIADTRYLELVNRDNATGNEPDDKLIVSAWPAVPVRVTSIMLHETTVEAVGELFAAAREDQVGTFFVSSGYRTYAEQKQIYDDMSDRSYAQPPGHSEHETGLAADILAMDVLQSEMDASREGQWLAANAWKYGLLLRYPQGKQDVTGIAYEPWHFRYVGQPHAWYCEQNDMCLEEYIQFLKDTGGYNTVHDGKAYTILYQTPQNGMLYVPEKLDYTISGDNTGGYIVTAWE